LQKPGSVAEAYDDEMLSPRSFMVDAPAMRARS
jgi:hypothetical protein